MRVVSLTGTNSLDFLYRDKLEYLLLRCYTFSGWKPPDIRTEYDILPIVVQYGDEEPHFYRLPEELVLRVKIRYPKYAS